MNGQDLSRKYFETHGLPMLEKHFSTLLDRVAAGLVGEGSECFGYDDELSLDHDFGPGFCLWLDEEDFRTHGARLQAAYDGLPASFLGVPVCRSGPHSGQRTGVFSRTAFYASHLGVPHLPRTALEWLGIPEERLAAATNGVVFRDPAGAFSAVRRLLLAGYPDDVRLKKIAARAALMAQSGQYNYARSMCRGETVAALLALAAFVGHAVSMVHLLNRRYTPFYKWAHRSLRALPVLPEAHGLLAELSLGGIEPARWQGDPVALAGGLNRTDHNVALVERLCRLVVERLQHEGLTDVDDDFLAAHAPCVMDRIQDSVLRSLHVAEG